MENRVWAIAAAGGVFCLAGCTHQQVEVARQVVAVEATSVSQTPPSSVFLPGASKVGDDRRAKAVTGSKPNGLGAQIIELRGWLGKVPGACNSDDPDWHWDLVLDPAWTDHLGVDLNDLITAGNINVHSDKRLIDTSQMVVGRPVVHVELNGFPPRLPPPNFPAPPADRPSSDWGFSNVAANCSKTKWAFNPNNPLPWQPRLKVNQYVRIVGSLVSDEPHAFTTTAAQGLWAAGRDRNDLSNPARWTEIHPPDIIAVLNDVDSSGEPTFTSSETVEGVTVFSPNCLVGTCAKRSLDVDIPAPLPKPDGASKVNVLECVGSETNFGTIVEGNSVNGRFVGSTVTTSGLNSAHIHVAVRGQSPWAAPGKFKAIYRVFWDTHKPNPPAPCHLVL